MADKKAHQFRKDFLIYGIVFLSIATAINVIFAIISGGLHLATRHGLSEGSFEVFQIVRDIVAGIFDLLYIPGIIFLILGLVGNKVDYNKVKEQVKSAMAPETKPAAEAADDSFLKENPTGPIECPNCQTKNPPAAKFCTDCGTALTKVCPQCGAINRLDARTCHICQHDFRQDPNRE